MITGHDLGTGPVLLRLRDIYKFGAAENQTTVSLLECKASGKLTLPIFSRTTCVWNACLTLVEETCLQDFNHGNTYLLLTAYGNDDHAPEALSVARIDRCLHTLYILEDHPGGICSVAP